MRALNWMRESTDGNNKPTAQYLSWLTPQKSGNKETVTVSMATPQTRAQHNKTNMSGLYPPKGKNFEPGTGTHTKKWDDCVRDVSAKGGADNAYAVCTAQLGPSKESAFKFIGRFRETASPAITTTTTATQTETPGRRFRTVLLQEGLGNLEDAYYYTADAIASCPPIFEGKKFFIDHPAADEEMTRPERSVRDIAGWFENLTVENAPDGRSLLVGDSVLLESAHMEFIRELMLESISYAASHPGQDLVGLSINAGGDFETIALEQFVRTEKIPEGCQAKLAEAVAKGISMIRPVRKMTSATSCDLVTEAGAGGRIAQLLERERGNMSAKVAAGKNKEKKEGAKEDGAGAAPGSDGSADGKAGGADDGAGDKDKELIRGMLSKFCGDGFTEEDHMMATEAYQAALEAHGGDEKEAMETAGRVMKMAKHAQARQAKAPPADGASAGGNAGSAPGGDGTAQQASDTKTGFVPGAAGPAASGVPKTAQVESAFGARVKALEDKVLTQTAENVALKAKIDERELVDFIDTKLRESKLPMSATKKFRECIKGIKTQKEVTEKLSIFQEAWVSAAGEGDGVGLFIQPEKGVTETAAGSFSAADCIET